jgi:hypothetical protein
MNKLTLILLVLLVPGIAFISCKTADDVAVKKTTQDFLLSLQNREYNEAMKMGTPATKQYLEMLAAFDKLIPDTAAKTSNLDLEIRSCDISGDTARCRYILNDKEEELVLIKIRGKWLVDMSKEGTNPEDERQVAINDSLAAVERAVQDSIDEANDRYAQQMDTTTYFDFNITEVVNTPAGAKVTIALTNRSQLFDIKHMWFSLFFSDKSGLFIKKQDVMFDMLKKSNIPEGDSVSPGSTRTVSVILENTSADNIAEIFISPIRLEVPTELTEWYYNYLEMPSENMMGAIFHFRDLSKKEIAIRY